MGLLYSRCRSSAGGGTRQCEIDIYFISLQLEATGHDVMVAIALSPCYSFDADQ